MSSVGASVFEQRRFVCWLARQWGREARWRGETLPARYVLAQLSRVAPFDKWTAFERYRTTYGAPGITAVVLGEDSAGEPDDVRRIDVVALPADEDAAAATVVGDGFQIDSGELGTARRAAMSLLAGEGLIVFLALWLLGGVRPYPRSVRAALVIGWLAVAGLILRLMIGSDPGVQLVLFVAVLFILWSGLVVTAVASAVLQAVSAWLAGRVMRRKINEQQIHFRMNGGLSVQGGSAGLAFCLNTLLANYRSDPGAASRSWLWQRFFRNLRHASRTWAATGTIEADGSVDHVVLEPKIRACLRNSDVTDVLTPWQKEAGQKAIDRVAAATRSVTRARRGDMVLAFATGQRKLRSHRCRHAAQSIFAVGKFASKSQLATNAMAIAVTVLMLLALPDIRNTLQPPAPPRAVTPGSPSPYYLWVSLDSDRSNAFAVSLESGFWSNRRANVVAYGGADASKRAELRLTRNGHQSTIDEQDGIVWIERRRKFLGREYQTGERVASFPFAHLTALPHD